MTRPSAVGELLRLCTLRVNTADGAWGTGFFVAPGYAVTAAHVVYGRRGLDVQLAGAPHTWEGIVEDSQPDADVGQPGPEELFPPPDVALIKLRPGPAHMCVLLADERPADGSRVTARGYSRTFDRRVVTAETESFDLTGELETTDPSCVLLKVGLGQAVPGMSGAPVLDISAGEVIGMLRTSRNPDTNLGGWVVPASLIRGLWPETVSAANDDFHAADGRWRRANRDSGQGPQQGPPDAASTSGGNVSIGTIRSDGPVTVITGGQFRDISISAPTPPGHKSHPGEPGTR